MKRIKEWFRTCFRKMFSWVFAEELKELDDIRYMLCGRVAISADIHHNTDSWAVISIKGQERDYVKFISLGKKDMLDILNFLKRYGQNVTVDTDPMSTRILKEGLWL